MSAEGPGDRFRQVLIDEGVDGIVLVESKMTRGSTHDKDRMKVTRFVRTDMFTESLDRIRADMQKDMWLKRRFDPEDFDTLEELEEHLRENKMAAAGAAD